jgi:P27 family predicted phage terminase small subunit
MQEISIMGKRGPVGAPTALRLLRGDPSSRINEREPTPTDVLPEPPPEMAEDVRAIWDYTLAELAYMKTAVAADRDSLVCYCEAVIAHRKSSAVLAKSQVLIKGLHGGMVRNPALQIQRDSAMTLRAFAQEFGLTPSARAGIVMGGARTSDHASPFTATG